MQPSIPSLEASALSPSGGRIAGRLWALPILGVGLTLAFRSLVAPWAFMWLLVAALLFAFKAMTWVASGERRGRRALGYFLFWPGLDPSPFLGDGPTRGTEPPDSMWSDLARGVVALAAGGVALWLVTPRLGNPYIAAWSGMVGIVLMLHFGVLHLLAIAWRLRGIAVTPLMDRPLSATSVTDFWSRRWNLAFRDFAHRFVFRPLRRSAGPRPALVAVYLFSGIAHEIVISLPARGGWGLPTLYFAIQAAATLGERRLAARNRRSLFFLATALPVPLLFHPSFLGNVIAPFLAAIGALPSSP